MKHQTIIRLLTKSTALASLLLLTSWTSISAAEQNIDKVIVQVESDIILQSELSRRVETVRRQLTAAGTRMPPEEVFRKQILDRLVLDSIQYQLAKRAGVRVSDDELNETISGIAQRSNMTLDQFREDLRQDGINYNLFREDVRAEMMASVIRNAQVNNKINISEREIDSIVAAMADQSAASEEYRLGHILLSVPENADNTDIDRIRAKAEELARRLENGEDFSEVAIAESDGREALNGGDFGWRSENQLPTLFAASVKRLNKGEVSTPIRSGSGFHILKLVDRRGEERVVINQTKARHILIKPDAITSDEAARVQLENVRERVMAGNADFAEMAKKMSDDKGSANVGGDLGWTNPGVFVPEFEQTMDELDIGEFSQPFRSQFGWHLMQVTDRRSDDQTDDMKKRRAQQILHQRKFNETVESWLREIREQAYVKFIEEETES